MIFQDENELIETIKKYAKKPCETIYEGRKEKKILEALVYGENFDILLEKIEQKEDDEKIKIRKKYSRNVVDLFERVLRPLDNVYSAIGTNKDYDLPESIKKNYISKISNIRDNKSLESWLEYNWFKSNYITDPAGGVMLEYKDNKVYPTLKSSECIRAYDAKGQNVDFIIFEPKEVLENSLLFSKIRVVDDLKDYEVIKLGNDYIVNYDNTFEHPFGQVPFIINSNLTDADGDCRISIIEKIVPLTKEYARDQSIKTLYKFSHGFPIFWRYVVTCSKCHGKGKTDDGATCSECDGHGFYRKRDVTDVVTLPIPKDGESKLAPDIAGFIAPELETWNQYIKELDLAEIMCSDTLFGSHIETGTKETATGRYIDAQPIITKLNTFGDVCQWVEWQLSEWIANFYDLTKPREKEVVQINYGRNYIIESPDVLLAKYADAKAKGVSTVVLDRLLGEYITSKYKTNPNALNENLKKLKIEPYVHYTVNEVFDIMGQLEAQKKMLFAEWWSTDANPNEDIDILTEKFNKFATNKIKIDEQD